LTVAWTDRSGDAACWSEGYQLNFAQCSRLTERVIKMIALLTVLSLAPSILVIMTSFIRIAVVLSLLRTALGTPPPRPVPLHSSSPLS
jgi:flagellar biosynthetic protein FliP